MEETEGTTAKEHKVHSTLIQYGGWKVVNSICARESEQPVRQTTVPSVQ